MARRALKDQGYESDSTLVFRKKENSAIAPLSPVEQKAAYINMQSGGEAPLQGFRKPAPEKPKGECRLTITKSKFWVDFLFMLRQTGAEFSLIKKYGFHMCRGRVCCCWCKNIFFAFLVFSTMHISHNLTLLLFYGGQRSAFWNFIIKSCSIVFDFVFG